MTLAPDRTTTTLDLAIERATERLLELQHPDGWWVGELESNATMVAQHLFWHHFLGLRTPELDRKIANELLARRRDDGTWAIWFEGPPDLSTTIEAYTALKLAGVDPGTRAREYIRSEGGASRARVFTKCFLALLGHWPWQWIARLPPEVILLPPDGPFSVYNFSCWARQTVVPLSVVQALRPVRPAAIDLREIGARAGQTRPAPRPGPIRRVAFATAERWVRDRQEADGSWGGIQPPWVWSIIMLAALGYGFEDETLRAAVEGWGGFTIDEGDRLRPEACQSPVWDTALAVLALLDAGVSAGHPALRRAGDWLVREEVTVSGDWAIRKPDLPPGGWAFEFENDFYPDVDDTAVVALALRGLGLGASAVERGLAWTAGMQSRSGGWGAFDVDNEAHWLYKLPFCDFGKVTDEPSADVSAHALEALAAEPRYAKEVERGLEWLLAEQEPDGSWFGRRGVNHIYGTGAALPALEACGLPSEHPSMRRAVNWLQTVQQSDGSFGEDIRSYSDPSWRGRGQSTPSQTAWALLGYVAAGEAGSDPARSAADWLCFAQRSNGDWQEDHYTGTGFPLDFMIRYHLYRLHFPLMALGRLRERLAA
ncbi:MAG: squalene--hopene cyclase [Actinobacteria bacterium]|nr:MAG: squalene--hopene cyclase [Actinomycetota bacterium]